MVLDTAALTGASPKFVIWRVSWTTPNRCLGNPDFFLAFRLDGGLLIGARHAHTHAHPLPSRSVAEIDCIIVLHCASRAHTHTGTPLRKWIAWHCAARVHTHPRTEELHEFSRQAPAALSRSRFTSPKNSSRISVVRRSRPSKKVWPGLCPSAGSQPKRRASLSRSSGRCGSSSSERLWTMRRRLSTRRRYS